MVPGEEVIYCLCNKALEFSLVGIVYKTYGIKCHPLVFFFIQRAAKSVKPSTTSPNISFFHVHFCADWLLSMKSPPALIYNSLILLCPINQHFILIGCLSLAVLNDIFTMAMADEGVLHLSHTLMVIASLFSPLLNKPLGLSFTVILISFHSHQSYLRKHLRPPFFLQCHLPISCCLTLFPLSNVDASTWAFFKHVGCSFVCTAYSSMLILVCKWETPMTKAKERYWHSWLQIILDSLKVLVVLCYFASHYMCDSVCVFAHSDECGMTFTHHTPYVRSFWPHWKKKKSLIVCSCVILSHVIMSWIIMEQIIVYWQWRENDEHRKPVLQIWHDSALSVMFTYKNLRESSYIWASALT